MRKFMMPARRFSSVVLRFTSPFIQSAAVPKRAADPAAERAANQAKQANQADRARQQAETGQAMTPHGYAEAAIRLSRTYW
ncbi:hypothetical protein CDC46_17750 (plasmid) [Ralstonia solanacearum]|uniref:hypothetical protein n=2 Tax=Ralstonia solanacearum TaxID=305 RepID=UPI0005AD0942|nr:hypothetical protein [Ralstonia solanacearum]AST34038.2 hypothetical protein CDC46_17750 [Ralstonia solanacearum]AYB54436.2 hypothetical protein C2I38_16530 [Ralstonia solanacearum]AYB57679.2 hypothetical protein C2L97_16530 [Ralstonia solanacearum]MDB0507980.1 hypothetical protein [Ralstonia solanacearum]MDB0512249.1 hypothetical protein [Ralstonia solanacearum]